MQEIGDPQKTAPLFQADTAQTTNTAVVIIEGEIFVESDIFYRFEKPDHPSVWFVLGFLCVLLPLSSLIFQLLLIYHTPRAVVSLLPKEQTINVHTSQQIKARELPALSLSQSKTAATSGHGHQDATEATGAITFYNGAFTSQFLPAGTILTGSNGTQVQTLQPAYLPAANPPSFAEATVLAHSMWPGSHGNIAAYDINTTLTASIFAKNTGSFTGGLDARDFPTVTKTDISNLVKSLTPSLTRSMSGALQSQLTPSEALYIFPCSPTITPDYQAGAEAATVKVTILETCRGLAYDKQDLQIRAANILTSKALAQFGTGYKLLQPLAATITQVRIQKNNMTFSLSCQATSIYQFSKLKLEQLKKQIAGKSTQEADRILLAHSGIQAALIDGVDESAALPINPSYISLTVLRPVA